jgi:OOP family OmpA-OmpF porin
MLTKIIKAIEEFPNARILISGHTDTVGDALTNKNLSIDRADKVARFIIDVGGVNGDRVTSTGYGKERPVANNETPEGRAANRRVEVLIDNSYGL